MLEGSVSWRQRYSERFCESSGSLGAGEGFVRAWGRAASPVQRVVDPGVEVFFTDPIMLLNPKVVDPRNRLKMPAILICEEEGEDGTPFINWSAPLGADDLSMLAVPEHECGLSEEEEYQIALDQEQWDREEEERRRLELRRIKAARKKRTKNSNRSSSPPSSPAASVPSPRKKPKRKNSMPTVLQEPRKLQAKEEKPTFPVDEAAIPKTVAELTTPRREMSPAPTTALPSTPTATPLPPHPLLCNTSPTISPGITVDPLPYLASLPKRAEPKLLNKAATHVTSSPPTTISKPIHREVVRMQTPHAFSPPREADTPRPALTFVSNITPVKPKQVVKVDTFPKLPAAVLAGAVAALSASNAQEQRLAEQEEFAHDVPHALAVLAACAVASYSKQHLLAIRRRKIEIKQSLVQKRLMEGRETSARTRVEKAEEEAFNMLRRDERVKRQVKEWEEKKRQEERERAAERSREREKEKEEMLKQQREREERDKELTQARQALKERLQKEKEEAAKKREEEQRREEARKAEVVRKAEEARKAEAERKAAKKAEEERKAEEARVVLKAEEQKAEVLDNSVCSSGGDPEPETAPRPTLCTTPFKPSLFQAGEGFSLTFSGMNMVTPTPDFTRPPRLTTMDKLSRVLDDSDSESETESVGSGSMAEVPMLDDTQREVVEGISVTSGEENNSVGSPAMQTVSTVAAHVEVEDKAVSSPAPTEPYLPDAVTSPVFDYLPPASSSTSTPTTDTSTENILLASPVLIKAGPQPSSPHAPVPVAGNRVKSAAPQRQPKTIEKQMKSKAGCGCGSGCSVM